MSERTLVTGIRTRKAVHEIIKLLESIQDATLPATGVEIDGDDIPAAADFYFPASRNDDGTFQIMLKRAEGTDEIAEQEFTAWRAIASGFQHLYSKIAD